jgi:hypothetical protein
MRIQGVNNGKDQRKITGRTDTFLLRRIFSYTFLAMVKWTVIFGLIVFAGCSPVEVAYAENEVITAVLQLKSRTVTIKSTDFYNAIYVENSGVRLLSGNRISADNGRTWLGYSYVPDFQAGLPYGYRRNRITSVCDPYTGRIITIINSLDTPGLDPGVSEPKLALSNYYLRYTVSNDAGKTWLFSDPMVQEGTSDVQNPFEGIFIGKNSFYLGDLGCIPIVTKNGRILVPAHATLSGLGGELLNPGGGYTYTDVIVLIGTWTAGNKILWKASKRVEANPKRSTRGMIEPTLLELDDGRILMVMRGSNGGIMDPKNLLPSYKWFAISNDGGETWSNPEPWTFEDGAPFFSPSSMSSLFKHSSGRCFWIGNLTRANCQGNLPRWPLAIAEINTDNLKLIRSSLISADTQREEDLTRGRLDISHVTLMEDRESKEIILTYPRNTNAYQTTEWITVRFLVSKLLK